jgi:hypothetical protein
MAAPLRPYLDLPFPARRFKLVLLVLAGINILFLIGMRLFLTYFRNLGDWNSAPPIKNLYTQVNLATENVVASWYSSMLLLLAALMAALCFGADRAGGRKKLAGGWLIVSAVFLLLSFDEMGSLHERIGMLKILNPSGGGALGWVAVLAIPIAGVTIYLAAFGWMRMRAVPHALILFGISLALLAANPVMELIEMRHLREDSESSIRAHDRWILAEEGAELFGFLLFSLAMALYISSVNRASAGLRLVIPGPVVRLIGIVLSLGAVVTLFAAGLVNVYMAEGDTGQPANWPPSVLAGLNAIVLVLLSCTRAGGCRALLMSAAVLCGLVSAYHGACMKFWLAASLPELNLTLTAAAVVLALPFLARARWRIRLGLGGALVTFAPGLWANPYHGSYLDVLSQGLLLVTMLEWQITAPADSTLQVAESS